MIDGNLVLGLARASILSELGKTVAYPALSERLRERGASSVEVYDTFGHLRGHGSTAEAFRQLGDDISNNAVSAAFRDPKRAPLDLDELDEVRLEVSVLETPERLVASDERAVLKQLRRGVDGVMIRYGKHHAAVLPQAWERYTNSLDMVTHLKHRAGIPLDFWSDEVSLSRFRVRTFREQ
ncbi:AmmeMemoRadiSam system protein A [Gulosibacter macacae]|uniref:AmmeMemoRadiSam system protein A n=1 Tax=Gulosibacter macacae TaxID=2488791 RepID=A0A3P3VST6_9MICO|nr:AmmeMemoRadiSam system protein A [Gulosibacter macacae]RRJ85815.1 AmmeMemoRadiSam system protein A [Gulosibacter macacae]